MDSKSIQREMRTLLFLAYASNRKMKKGTDESIRKQPKFNLRQQYTEIVVKWAESQHP